jgi:hypothetical protein
MLAVLIGSLVLVGVTSAQVPADLPSAAIAAAKQARVADLDPALPRDTSFDTWLAFVTGRSAAEVGWEANDCGEQSGDPARDRGRDFPLCAEARVRGVNYSCRSATTISAGEGLAKEPRWRPQRELGSCRWPVAPV